MHVAQSKGQAYDLVFSGFHNMVKVLELAINGGINILSGQRRSSLERTLVDYQTFDDLFAVFANEFVREYQVITRAVDLASESFATFRSCYLLSSLVCFSWRPVVKTYEAPRRGD